MTRIPAKGTTAPARSQTLPALPWGEGLVLCTILMLVVIGS
jgi:hypothetical protein